MIGTILGILNGAIRLANKAAEYFRKKDDQNTGRKLQQADDLAATVKGATDAQRIREDVNRMSAGDLARELREGSKPAADR